MAQIERAAELRSIHAGVHRRFALFAGNRAGLDLDHFHAIVGEQFGSQRTGILLREIGHTQTFEHWPARQSAVFIRHLAS